MIPLRNMQMGEIHKTGDGGWGGMPFPGSHTPASQCGHQPRNSPNLLFELVVVNLSSPLAHLRDQWMSWSFQSPDHWVFLMSRRILKLSRTPNLCQLKLKKDTPINQQVMSSLPGKSRFLNIHFFIYKFLNMYILHIYIIIYIFLALTHKYTLTRCIYI